jgi:hypothetical protein
MCLSGLFISFVNILERKSEIYEWTIIRTVWNTQIEIYIQGTFIEYLLLLLMIVAMDNLHLLYGYGVS